MRLSHTIEYYSLLGFARLLCFLPQKMAIKLGSTLGTFGWAVGFRRGLVLSNIANACPRADSTELNRIGRLAARNFGRTVAEFIRFGIKDRTDIAKLIAIDGMEPLKETLSKGQGAIILTGHFGAWALYFAAVALAGIPLSLLVGKQHNEKVDAFIHKIPGDKVELITKGRAAIKIILEKLKLGRAVVIVADQHAGDGGVIAPFLGKNASTLALPGSLAVKYNVPVFIMTGYRQANGTHKVTIARLEIPKVASPDDRKLAVMQRYNEELGRIVMEWPEHYLWYHRRWRQESETSVS